MDELRLGDVIDDFCVKCRRITNHSIVSIVNGEAAKVRCRTCYNDHDYRHEQAPPSRKELKKAELFKEVLATVQPVDGPPPEEATEADETPEPAEAVPDPDPAPAPVKKARGRKA